MALKYGRWLLLRIGTELCSLSFGACIQIGSCKNDYNGRLVMEFCRAYRRERSWVKMILDFWMLEEFRETLGLKSGVPENEGTEEKKKKGGNEGWT